MVFRCDRCRARTGGMKAEDVCAYAAPGIRRGPHGTLCARPVVLTSDTVGYARLSAARVDHRSLGASHFRVAVAQADLARAVPLAPERRDRVIPLLVAAFTIRTH